MECNSKKRHLISIAKSNKRSKVLETPLTLAIVNNDNYKINYFLRNKLYLNKLNIQGVSPLLLSIKLDNFDLFIRLLKIKEIDINLWDSKYKRTPLNFATTLGCKGLRYVMAILSFIDRKPILPLNANGIDLLISVATRLPSNVSFHNPIIDLPSCDGKTPLIIASRYKKLWFVVKKLLESGANVNSFDDDLNSAIIIATYFNNINIVKILISYQANVNQLNKLNQSPLYLAVMNGNLPMVKLLIKNHADINAKVGNKSLIGRAIVRSKKSVKYLKILKVIIENKDKIVNL